MIDCFSSSHCLCDRQLYSCLKSVRGASNRRLAADIGTAFFNVLSMSCLGECQRKRPPSRPKRCARWHPVSEEEKRQERLRRIQEDGIWSRLWGRYGHYTVNTAAAKIPITNACTFHNNSEPTKHCYEFEEPLPEEEEDPTPVPCFKPPEKAY